MFDPERQLLMLLERDGTWKLMSREVNDVRAVGQQFEVTFKGSSTYRYGRSRVYLTDVMEQPIPPGRRVYLKGALCPSQLVGLAEVDTPGGTIRRLRFRRADGSTWSSDKLADSVEIVQGAQTDPVSGPVLGYFKQVVSMIDAGAPIVDAYGKLSFVHPESVLAHFAAGRPIDRAARPESVRIFPFRTNLSQRQAVEQALSSKLSVIEGPPGTGKTQTILNIIANVVASDLGTVGVVSQSNAAVDNVYEKLQEAGFGHIVANLGNASKRKDFFDHQARTPVEAHAVASVEPPNPDALAAVGERLQQAERAERERALARLELDALVVEHEHFARHVAADELAALETLPLLRKPSDRLIEFLAEARIDADVPPGMMRRIIRRFRYGRLTGVDLRDTGVLLRVQDAFYERRKDELRATISQLDGELDRYGVDELSARYQRLSEQEFAAALAARTDGTRRSWSAKNYRQQFERFVSQFPVVLSTCHSLRSSLPDGKLLDYVIIDESSQVDLLTAALALAACRNVVIVGDTQQLPQISEKLTGVPDCPRPEYDYSSHSVLSSVKALYGDQLPVTLLREHYRCYPAIIGFCNNAYYDGELIPFTTGENRPGPAMQIHRTPPGNHMRRNHSHQIFNQREIDVIRREVLPLAFSGIEAEQIAVAAPYRHQADRATEELGDAVALADTVHKLQGRQKRMVAMTTVLSETRDGHIRLRFVDDPHLINVAVSRAVDQFVVVTNNDGLPRSRHLRSLFEYIEYHYPDQQPVRSDVISAFDLLYAKYDERLQALAARLNPAARYRSEDIIRVMLGDLLAEEPFVGLRLSAQVLLRNLVGRVEALTDQERSLLAHGSSVDFVISSVASHRALLVVEVDGGRHLTDTTQIERDRAKDALLARGGIRLKRLPTHGLVNEAMLRETLEHCLESPLTPP